MPDARAPEARERLYLVFAISYLVSSPPTLRRDARPKGNGPSPTRPGGRRTTEDQVRLAASKQKTRRVAAPRRSKCLLGPGPDRSLFSLPLSRSIPSRRGAAYFFTRTATRPGIPISDRRSSLLLLSNIIITVIIIIVITIMIIVVLRNDLLSSRRCSLFFFYSKFVCLKIRSVHTYIHAIGDRRRGPRSSVLRSRFFSIRLSDLYASRFSHNRVRSEGKETFAVGHARASLTSYVCTSTYRVTA